MGVAIYFFTILPFKTNRLNADGKRAIEYWFDDTQILSNSLSLKLAKLQATRIGTRNAAYILKNTVREGWNYIQTPREARAEKCVCSSQATLHSNTSL